MLNLIPNKIYLYLKKNRRKYEVYYTLNLEPSYRTFGWRVNLSTGETSVPQITTLNFGDYEWDGKNDENMNDHTRKIDLLVERAPGADTISTTGKVTIKNVGPKTKWKHLSFSFNVIDKDTGGPVGGDGSTMHYADAD